MYQFFSLLLSLLMLSPLFGGGLFLYEIGSSDLRLASSGWSSRAEDPSTLFTNPAGMSRICSKELQLGLQPVHQHIVFDPNSKTETTGSHGNASAWVPAASFFYVQPVNDKWSVGFGNLGYFGASLDFNKNWVGRYYVTETTLQGISFIPAVSYQVNPCLSLGLGVNFMYGMFKDECAINNRLDGTPDGKLKLKDHNWGTGIVAGILYEVNPCFRVGLQYLSKVTLNFKDKPHFKDIGPTLLARLEDAKITDSSIHLRAKAPQSVMLGATWDFNPCFSFMSDIGWQQWSEFQQITVTIPTDDPTSLTFAKKYNDTWHFALGSSYHYSDCLTFSLGAAYDSSAVSNSQRTLAFPVGAQWRLGTGFEWVISNGFTIDLAYECQYSGNLKVDQHIGDLPGRVSGEFKDIYASFLELVLKWNF